MAAASTPATPARSCRSAAWRACWWVARHSCPRTSGRSARRPLDAAARPRTLPLDGKPARGTIMCIKVEQDAALCAANRSRIDAAPPWHTAGWNLQQQDDALLTARLEDVARASGDWAWETD